MRNRKIINFTVFISFIYAILAQDIEKGKPFLLSFTSLTDLDGVKIKSKTKLFKNTKYSLGEIKF